MHCAFAVVRRGIVLFSERVDNPSGASVPSPCPVAVVVSGDAAPSKAATESTFPLVSADVLIRDAERMSAADFERVYGHGAGAAATALVKLKRAIHATPAADCAGDPSHAAVSSAP